jgi:hypothetical protein
VVGVEVGLDDPPERRTQAIRARMPTTMITTMTATEVLTLAPLGALVVVFGLFPGVLLDLVREPVAVTLGDAANGTPIALDPLVPVVGIGVLVAVVAARLFALRPGRPADTDAGSALTTTEGAA